jgi:hypothetical protein
MEPRKLTTTEREMLKLKINRAAEKHPEFKAKIMKLADKEQTNKEQK